MVKRTGSSNEHLKRLIVDLDKLGKKEKAPLWKRIAYELKRSRRSRRNVNISRIDRHARKDEIALVPGKILSDGELSKKLTVAGYRFSDMAREKINKSGRAMSIEELMKENPKGKKVRIIG